MVPLNSAAKEWSLTITDGEEIILIAASSALVCYVTTTYNLRICSLYGLQKGVIRIPGPVVSISAQENSVLVAYHMSSTRDKDQCIMLTLFRIEGKG